MATSTVIAHQEAEFPAVVLEFAIVAKLCYHSKLSIKWGPHVYNLRSDINMHTFSFL